MGSCCKVGWIEAPHESDPPSSPSASAEQSWKDGDCRGTSDVHSPRIRAPGPYTSPTDGLDQVTFAALQALTERSAAKIRPAVVEVRPLDASA